MFKQCNGLNSKCFLLTYLVIVGFLLILWANRLPLVHEETRLIPQSLQPYLFSPPRSITEAQVETASKLVLTSEIFVDKWSFVYFSHDKCLPVCSEVYSALSELQAALQVSDIQFVLVDLDTSSRQTNGGDLRQLAEQVQLRKTFVIRADQETIALLAKNFGALFLQTDFTNGTYQIEQEHPIFVVDPKGRLYARFSQPYNFELIRDMFVRMRQFYASSE